MNQVYRASRIFVAAGDGARIIADISKVPAGEGILGRRSADGGSSEVNVETMNAEVMGHEVTVILTTDCYDHSPCVLNQTGFQAVGDDVPALRTRNKPGVLATMGGNPKDAGVGIGSVRILSPQTGHAMMGLKTQNRPEANGAENFN